MLQPFKGRVYDPCCGSGGMFVQSAKFVENHSGNINDISIYGQDSNPTTWKLAQMNLAIRGIEPDLGKYAADTFLDDQHPTMRADYIMQIRRSTCPTGVQSSSKMMYAGSMVCRRLETPTLHGFNT